MIDAAYVLCCSPDEAYLKRKFGRNKKKPRTLFWTPGFINLYKTPRQPAIIGNALERVILEALIHVYIYVYIMAIIYMAKYIS